MSRRVFDDPGFNYVDPHLLNVHTPVSTSYYCLLSVPMSMFYNVLFGPTLNVTVGGFAQALSEVAKAFNTDNKGDVIMFKSLPEPRKGDLIGIYIEFGSEGTFNFGHILDKITNIVYPDGSIKYPKPSGLQVNLFGFDDIGWITSKYAGNKGKHAGKLNWIYLCLELIIAAILIYFVPKFLINHKDEAAAYLPTVLGLINLVKSAEAKNEQLKAIETLSSAITNLGVSNGAGFASIIKAMSTAVSPLSSSIGTSVPDISTKLDNLQNNVGISVPDLTTKLDDLQNNIGDSTPDISSKLDQLSADQLVAINAINDVLTRIGLKLISI